ncbi:MAG: dTDP-4-dehydrorhamnose 3,5-epimerase [Acidobacteria bacterium]|nr:dTDP-4-dehydrorhamnose 3,5-epimerase [Acidobacteriota bacterium]
MVFRETKLAGAFVIEQELFEDERGFFARSWSEREFAAQGLATRLAECNISFNKQRGTLRGMHFQREPHAQAKLVRCTAGAIYDVIIDLRPESPTCKQWIGVELTARNRRMLYVPEGFAHGFQTLEDETEIFYQMSDVYAPEAGGGVRWDDPAFGIVWLPPDEDGRIINARDREYPDFTAGKEF